VTAAACREHVAPLRSRITEAVTSARAASGETRASILAGIRNVMAESPASSDLRSELEAACRGLGTDQLAVRSTGTAEDLPGHSFAGLYDTTLGRADADRCVMLVKKCWASLWTERAFEYREKNLFDHLNAGMAVIVQELVPADAAGVCFTADPVSGSRDRIVLEAVSGLGDKLVSGHVTPDRFVLDRRLRIVERPTATPHPLPLPKSGASTREGSIRPQGAREPTCLPTGGAKPAVDDRQARAVARLALKAERLFGAPQDVEWAVAGRKAWLLQARPITTLGGRTWADRQVWTNVNISEALPEPAPPMALAVADVFLAGIIKWLLKISQVSIGEHTATGGIASRVYINLNTLLGILHAIPLLRRMKLSELLGGLSDEQMPRPDDVLRVQASPLKALLGLPGLFVWFLFNQPERGRRIMEELRLNTDRLQQTDYAAMPDQELARQPARGLTELLELPKLPGAGAVLTGMMYYSTLFNVSRKWFRDPESTVASHLLTSLGDIDSAQAGLDLWRLARLAQAHPEVGDPIRSDAPWAELVPRLQGSGPGREFLSRWDALMFRQGHHCRGEFDVSKPRWREQPDFVLDMIRSYARAGAALNPEADLKRRQQEREQFTAEVRARLRNPVKRLLFDWLLSRARLGASSRENVRNDSNRRAAIARMSLLELGNRLAGRGVLAERDDVFFLTVSELAPVLAGTQSFDVRRTIADRKARFEQDRQVTPPPLIVGRFDPSRHLPEAAAESAEELRGLAVSPGVVTGRARVILQADPSSRVLPGEILVAPYTDPGWTPYFLPAAGIVVDVGGLLSHGSIVAREYGIPAVVNVGPATRVIKTGQLVEVDGNQGRVRILKESAG
jgi:pyruvate,water dikinase